MRQGLTMRSRLVLLSLVVSLLAFSVGCAKPTRVGVNCPKPTWDEVDDYEKAVEKNPDRPLVIWNARLIAYCWPELSELERHGE